MPMWTFALVRWRGLTGSGHPLAMQVPIRGKLWCRSVRSLLPHWRLPTIPRLRPIPGLSAIRQLARKASKCRCRHRKQRDNWRMHFLHSPTACVARRDSDDLSAVAQRAKAEAIHAPASGAMDCFASLAMTIWRQWCDQSTRRANHQNPVHPFTRKHSARPVGQIIAVIPRVSPERGAGRDRRERRGGMRWTLNARRTNAREAYGEVVWS